MNRMDSKEWIATVTGGDTTRSIAKKIDIAHTTIARQVTANSLTEANIIAISRAYGANPVDEFIRLGILDESEVENSTLSALRRATNEQILEELQARSSTDGYHFTDAGYSDNVIHLGAASSYYPEDAVADDSPEEGDGLPDDYEP